MNSTALNRLRAWMAEQGLEHIFIQQPENFAWLTEGGENTVVVFRPVGAALEVTPHTVRLHSSSIEAARLLDEEVGDLEVVRYPWYAPFPPSGPNDSTYNLTALRLVLSPTEQERYRILGQETALALGESVRSANPDWSEYELAAAISKELLAKGIQPLVLLVAGEERVFRYRHPVPKQRPLGRLFMAVVCGRRQGLVVSATRLRSFGHPQAQHLNQQVCQIEAAMLNASQPGATLDEVLGQTRAAYAAVGRAEEFENHHQGGITGYKSREVLAVPGQETRLEPGMALAWNPSLPGGKVEDTFLLTEAGLENLTADPNWPTLKIEGRLRPMVYKD
ncbi:MAG: M24 family metallopeptidase [Thermaceae bacterium]|nr:M24 family metallopeptidase [Thermaceae bacterium]